MTAVSKIHVLINAINDNEQPRGPDRYLLELVPALMSADPMLDIEIVHGPWQGELRRRMSGFGVRLRCLTPPRSPILRLFWQAIIFPKYANKTNPDVVFLPNLIFSPRIRSRIVMTAHDLLHFRAPSKFGTIKAALLRQIIKLAVRRANRIIAVSDFTRSDLVGFTKASEDRVKTILAGGPKPIKRGAKKPSKFFLYAGKLERTKGIEDLITAFCESKKLADQNYQLYIVGPDGNASKKILKKIENSYGNVERLGFVSEEKLDDLFLTCRGFVFPSTAEGFGLVVLEAMAKGAPVIAARATSLPEVVGDAGMLFSPGDIGALTEALERLAFDDELYLSLQKSGYARLADFSWKRAGIQTARFLREMAG